MKWWSSTACKSWESAIRSASIALNFAEKMATSPDSTHGAPSVLLYHSPTQVAAAKAAGINLQLSGHVHQGQLFPLQFVTRLMFGKYYHGLHT